MGRSGVVSVVLWFLVWRGSWCHLFFKTPINTDLRRFIYSFNHKSFCFLQRLVYDFGHVITYDNFIQSPTYYKLSLIFDEIRYSKQEIANRGPNEMR